MRTYWLKRFLTLAAFLGILALVFLGIYIYRQGFANKWRQYLQSELAERGVFVSFGRLTLDPIRGLVAKKLVLHEGSDHEEALAFVDESRIDFDFTELLKGKLALRSLDLRSASLLLPLDDTVKAEASNVVVSDFNARVIFLDDRLEIVNLVGVAQGIKFKIDGSLFLPLKNDTTVKAKVDKANSVKKTGVKSDLKSEELDRNILARLERENSGLFLKLRKIVKFLEKFDFAESKNIASFMPIADNLRKLSNTSGTVGNPLLDIKLRGSLDELANLEIDWRFAAREISCGSYRIKNLQIDGDYRSGTLSAHRVFLRDAQGDMQGSATWSANENLFFSFESSAHLLPLVEHLSGKKLPLFRLRKTPGILARGEVDAGGDFEHGNFPGRLMGSLSSERIEPLERKYRSLSLEKLRADFFLEGDKFYLRNVNLRHNEGYLKANVIRELGEDGIASWRYQGKMRMDPTLFLPLLPEGGGFEKFLRNLSFDADPAALFTFSGEGAGKEWRHGGKILLAEPFYLRGQRINYYESFFEYANKVLELREVLGKREDGVTSADSITIDGKRKTLRIEGGKCFTHPAEFLSMFHEPTTKVLRKFEFSKPPLVKADGVFDFLTWEDTDFQIVFSSSELAMAKVLKTSWPLKNATGKLHFRKDKLFIKNLNAELLDGNFLTDMIFSGLKKGASKTYEVVAVGTNVKVDELLSLYGLEGESGGELDFNFRGKGILKKIGTLNAEGQARVSEGVFYSLPLLGPLSSIIKAIAPFAKDITHSTAKLAKANFRIENGVIRSDNIEAHTPILVIKADGSCDMNDNLRLDLSASANARGVVGFTLKPVSKLLEFSCEGTLANPKWRPKVFRLIR